MSAESSITTARRIIDSLTWRTSLSRVKSEDLVTLIADAVDDSVADVLTELARAEDRLAEAIRALDNRGTGESRAAADAHTSVAQRLRATARVRSTYATLRTLAEAHPELRFDPDYRCVDETSLQIGLHSYTLDETLTALHAWTRHVTDPELRLDRPEAQLEPALRLTGQLADVPIAVVGVLRPDQPTVTAFLARHPGSADDIPLPLDILGELTNPAAPHLHGQSCDAGPA